MATSLKKSYPDGTDCVGKIIRAFSPVFFSLSIYFTGLINRLLDLDSTMQSLMSGVYNELWGCLFW